MKYALLDSRRVAADWAAELPDHEFAPLRTKLSCVGCGSAAYLNRGSVHQAAYFASKKHADDCNEAYQGSSGSDSALVKANTIVIVIKGSGEATDEAYATGEVGPRRRTSLSQGSESAETPTRRGVDAILQELLANPNLATSSKKIVVDKVETQASEFFVPFLQLGEQHLGRPIGVWGEASDFRQLTSMAFLNRGDGKPDIRIPMPVFTELKRLYKFSSPKEVEGAKFLLIGTFAFPLGCRIEDAKQIAIQIKSV